MICNLTETAIRSSLCDRDQRSQKPNQLTEHFFYRTTETETETETDTKKN